MASARTPHDMDQCHFLRIPKGIQLLSPCISYQLMQTELRLIIYRQLLFETIMIPMIPLSPTHDPLDESDGDEWTDEDSDYLDPEDQLDDMFFENRIYIQTEEDGITKKKNLKRYPAILRTNRQIYSEASSLLYTEAILIIHPGDIFCLRKKPRDLEFGAPNPCPWRHNPLKGVGKFANGIAKYETAEMGGRMEPHVFARFQKIYFLAIFDFEHTERVELWIDDDTHILHQGDILAYQEILDSSHVMKDFVNIVSRSPRITKLEIYLEVEIMASSNHLLQDGPDDVDEEVVDWDSEKQID